MRIRAAVGFLILATTCFVLACSNGGGSATASPTAPPADAPSSLPAGGPASALEGFVCSFMDGGKSLNATDLGTTRTGSPSCTRATLTDLPPFVCSLDGGAIVLSPSTDPQPFETPAPRNCVANTDAQFLQELLDLKETILIYQGVCNADQVRNGAGVCLNGLR